MGRTKKMPKGIRTSGNGYEARAQVRGIKICLYNDDLDQLVADFEAAKNRARSNMEYNPETLTLDEWYSVWFNQVKIHIYPCPGQCYGFGTGEVRTGEYEERGSSDNNKRLDHFQESYVKAE